jgi:hypothetical protein
MVIKDKNIPSFSDLCKPKKSAMDEADEFL